MSGRLNPADCATRSRLEEEALPSLWLRGPEFLYQPEEMWPVDLPWAVVKEEQRLCRVLHATVPDPAYDWEKVRIQSKDIPKLVKLEGDFKKLVLCCQEEAFGDDIHRLKGGRAVKAVSKLLPFNPFVDDVGLLRMGGRIDKSDLPYDAKHPPLLPGRHPFTRQIIQAFHERLLHAGTDFVLTQLRQHFWIIRG